MRAWKHRPKPKRKLIPRIFDWLRANPWLVTVVIAVSTISVTQRQLALDREVRVRVECRSVDRDVPPKVRFDDRIERAWVGFAAHCAIRNVGSRTTDLVEVRNGLSRQGKTFITNKSLFLADYERADDVKVNGDPFTKPVTLPPGAAAIIDMTAWFPIEGFLNPEAFAHLRRCAAEAQLPSARLGTCMGEFLSQWTSLMRGANRADNLETDTSYADGFGVNVRLSDDSFVYAELPFIYFWGWSCRGGGVGPLPKYLDPSFCTRGPRTPSAASTSR